MHWHAQITSLTLRGYDEPDGFARHLPFMAVAQVEFLSGGRCFIHGFLRADGKPIEIAAWKALRRMLREEFGVTEILADRHGDDTSYDTAPAPL